jgi:hypothetical protein
VSFIDGGASRSEPPPPGSFSFPGGGAWNHARRLSFVRFFGNPLIIVLLVASAVSLSLGDRVGGLIIIAMVLLSVLLNFFMEFQARHAVWRRFASRSRRAPLFRTGWFFYPSRCWPRSRVSL